MKSNGCRPKNIDIQKRIFRINRLAAMPQAVWRLMAALEKPDVSISELEQIIESDMALSAKILSLANSAYYGFNQKTASIPRAVVIIGFHELALLALGSGLAEIFNPRAMPASFDHTGLWLHSLAVGWVARHLAECVRYQACGEIMMAGLLHDVGKFVLATHFQTEFIAVMQRMEHGEPFHRAELLESVSHQMLGAMLAKRWGLPNVLQTVIGNHHQPDPQAPYYHAVCLTSLADAMVKEMDIGLVHDSTQFDRSEALKGAGLDIDQYDRVVDIASRGILEMVERWQRFIGHEVKA